MRDKLIELIQNAVDGCSSYWAGLIADYLIANGVTVQKWIPVSEMSPTYTSNYLVYLAKPVDGKIFPLGHAIAAYIARDECCANA